VRLHMERHAYGTATTEQFFDSLASTAGDARVLASMKSFVDQQGVPVVRVERQGGALVVSQRRYGLYGTQMPPQQWLVPFCVRSGITRACSLLDAPSARLPLAGTAPLMPNAGGTGYYRFSLAEADWRALIAEASDLPSGEALALNDSLWAGFQAGEVSPALLLEAARAMRGNAYAPAAADGGLRLASLRRQGLLPASEAAAYRAFVSATWGPMLEPLGFDPRAGQHATDAPERQQLRSYVASLLANEARDPALQARLAAAAAARLKGDASALDDTFLGDALRAHVALGGEAGLGELFERAVTSDETLFRRNAMRALGSAGNAAAGRWVLDRMGDERLRFMDRLSLLSSLSGDPETRQIAFDWLVAHYEELVSGAGIFAASTLPTLASGFCSVEAADAVEAALRPLVLKHGRGALELDRTVEQVRSCGLLRAHRGKELETLFR